MTRLFGTDHTAITVYTTTQSPLNYTSGVHVKVDGGSFPNRSNIIARRDQAPAECDPTVVGWTTVNGTVQPGTHTISGLLPGFDSGFGIVVEEREWETTVNIADGECLIIGFHDD